MSVRKVRNTWWVDFRFRGSRYRKRSPENTRGSALAYESLLRRRLSNGEPLEASEAPPELPQRFFGEFSAEWYETYVRTNNKPSEQRTKEIVLRVHLVPYFGKMKLQDITALEVEKYKAVKKKSGLAAKTVNNHMAALFKCLRCANEWGLTGFVPRMVLLNVPPQRFDFLTPVESDQLLRDCREPMWHQMALMALRTGMRLGELFGLDWSDIDFKRGVITVRHSLVREVLSSPKNNLVRHIPMTPEVVSSLLKRRKDRGLVFHRPGGKPLSYGIAGNAIKRLYKRAGLRKIGWHVLRHTFASQLAAAGVPMLAIQNLLGHATIQMTTRYAHLAPITLHNAVDLLDVAGRPSEVFNLGQQAVNTRRILLSPVN